MIAELTGVSKQYGRVHALDGADLAIPEGSVTGLVGPNGAGKTTSMLILSSLLDRDAGSVSVAGVDPAVDPRGVRRVVGYMPDFFGVYQGLTSEEYLAFFASANGIRAAARPRVVADLLALVGLEPRAGDDVNTLSRGMKQRLSLARALVHDPDLLILDEPASGLDPRARVHLRELIAELSRLGKTVLISSHILSELEGICTYLAVVDRGKVVAQGSMDAIRGSLAGHAIALARVPDGEVDLAEELLLGTGVAHHVAIERGLLRVTLDSGDASSAQLLAALVSGGVSVSEWRLEAAGLEELFLRITEDE